MRINRWIFVPLIFALSMGILFAWMDSNYWLGGLLYGFTLGAIEGLIIQLWSEYRTKSISRTKEEKDFSILQKRNIVLLLNLADAFNVCEESIEQLGNARIKYENRDDRFIKAKTKINFHSFGTEIKVNLTPLNDSLTEVEISTRPSLRTIVVDYGESLNVIEKMSSFLKEKDAEINKKILIGSVEILNEIYVKPSRKEKA
jgi:hypothetical protein